MVGKEGRNASCHWGYEIPVSIMEPAGLAYQQSSLAHTSLAFSTYNPSTPALQHSSTVLWPSSLALAGHRIFCEYFFFFLFLIEGRWCRIGPEYPLANYVNGDLVLFFIP